MDIFGSVDTEALLASAQESGSQEPAKPTKARSKPTKDLDLGVRWREKEGMIVSVPESQVAAAGWRASTQLDLIIHDNVMILFPFNGYLKLKKPSKQRLGREILIPKEQFKDLALMDDLQVENIRFDDVTSYHRLVIEFNKPIPQAFTH